MSIELPEAWIFAAKMQEALPGKVIESVDTKDMERMLGLAEGKEHLFDFDSVVGRTVEAVTAMGLNYKDRECPNCGTPIKKLAHGGGHVYLCPSCQVE